MAYTVQSTSTYAQNNYATSAVRDIQRRSRDREYEWGFKRVQKELDRVQELNHHMLEKLERLKRITERKNNQNNQSSHIY